MTLLLSMMLITTFLLCFRLHAGGLNGRIAKRKPLTNRRIRAARRRWAARVQDWAVDRNWWHVVFSDEFRVTLFKCDGRTIVWRQEGERYVPACLNPPRSQSRASLMFWGCIGFGRAGNLVEVQGNMDRHNYIDILQQHLLPSASDIFGHQNPNFVFQQDNAPPHTARDTVAWLENQDFQQMLWPGNSPDMNIIETVWGRIMDRLRNEPPLTIAELRQRVHQHWGEVTPQYLRSLYAGLPRRAAALRRARGYPTKYWGNMHQEVSYLAAQLWTLFSIDSVHRKCR